MRNFAYASVDRGRGTMCDKLGALYAELCLFRVATERSYKC